MTTTVQARLDEETLAALERLRRDGLSTSEVIRRGIQLVERERPAQPRLVGVGMFDSGIADLATNKKHLEGFGQKSIGRAK